MSRRVKSKSVLFLAYNKHIQVQVGSLVVRDTSNN